MAQHHERTAEDHTLVSDRAEVKVVRTDRGDVTLSITEETPPRRITNRVVERLREIGASRELLDLAERGAAEDAQQPA